MSKKNKGIVCVYCGKRVSTSTDHVFARQFFLPEHRRDLPQAPACATCNNEKSTIEHYLTALLPFGGRHQEARRMLAQMVPPRLARNRKLHASLRSGIIQGWSHERDGLVLTSGIRINADRVLRYMELVTRGLMWHHWRVHLRERDTVAVHALTAAGRRHFDRIFERNAAQRIRANLGRGTFIYEGAQAIDSDHVTVWRIAGYGGMQFGDPDRPGENCSSFGIFTGPEPSAVREATQRDNG